MNYVSPAVCLLLLRFGANPSTPGPEGILPLHVAAATGEVEVAEMLVDYGADPLLPMKGTRITPMEMALSNERVSCAGLGTCVYEQKPLVCWFPARSVAFP